MKAETGAIEAAAGKADNGSLAVTLTNEISKSVQVQLANEMKKVQLFHQEQQAYINRAMLQMRQLLVSFLNNFFHYKNLKLSKII